MNKDKLKKVKELLKQLKTEDDSKEQKYNQGGIIQKFSITRPFGSLRNRLKSNRYVK